MVKKWSQQHAPEELNEITRTQKTNRLILFVFGLISGVIMSVVFFYVAATNVLLVTHQSRFGSIEETCDQLKTAIEANGWENPGIRNMNKAVAKHGVAMEKQVRIVELCNASYAKEALVTNPEVSPMMPCAWGVYEGDDGNVYISSMNIGLLGKIFGGHLAKVMESISSDEKRMLERVIRK